MLKEATGLQEEESTAWGVGEKYSERSYYICDILSDVGIKTNSIQHVRHFKKKTFEWVLIN